jgi:hypothetical protein
MKFLKTIAFVLMLGTAFMACKKDSESTPNPTPSNAIEGKYTGLYGFDDEGLVDPFILNIKPGGVFQEIGVHSGAPTGQGTWHLNGNKLTANYKMLFAPYNEYSVSLTFDATGKKLTGTWGFDKSTTDGGPLEVKK